ncbi:MAG: PKD domain-containing protein, partial [Actinomycetota bacterium]|nr:PKD domain-containing protein [Actinomycetota bacterium]
GSWEEVDTGPPGADFGWPCYEGGSAGSLAQNIDFAATPECQSYYAANSAVAPTHSYSHAAGSAAIVLGEFVTGGQWPTAFDNSLIVGDFVRGTLDGVRVTDPSPTTAPLASDVLAVAAEFGPDGHLYFAGIGTGSIERIRYAPGEVAGGFARTTTGPPVASTISLSGLARSDWGLDWLELAPGPYLQCFSDVPGWVTPACQSIDITSGATTVSEGAFVRQATLAVTTSVEGIPNSVVSSAITLDGVPAAQWGLRVERAPAPVEVCFGRVTGLTPPECQTPVLHPGAVTNVTAVFTPDATAPGPGPAGELRVFTTPPVPTTVSVDGVALRQFGLEWVPFPAGFHHVCFSDVPGYSTPPCQTVEIGNGAVTAVEGVFERLGALQVSTDPATNVVISVDGVRRNQWGLFTAVPAGEHTVCASFISGEVCTPTTVAPAATNTIVLSPQAVVPPNQTPTADAGLDQLVVDSDRTGTETVTLDGSASFDPDGTIVSYLWQEASVAIGSGPTPAVALPVGVHPIELTVTDEDGASASAIVQITVEAAPPVVYVSSTQSGTVGAIAYSEEDVLSYDSSDGTWSMFFDGSDVGLPGNGGRNLDAVTLLDDGSMLLSTGRDGTLDGVGDFAGTDVLRFVPSSLGATTAGSFELYFDGSDVGLSERDENIDAVHLLANGDLIISTEVSVSVPGISNGTSSDLLRFTPTSLGAVTAGTWSLHLDASDVGLADQPEGIAAVTSDFSGSPLIATVGPYALPELSGSADDVLACGAAVTGTNNSCSFSLFWDGSAEGFAGGVDALHLG